MGEGGSMSEGLFVDRQIATPFRQVPSVLTLQHDFCFNIPTIETTESFWTLLRRYKGRIYTRTSFYFNGQAGNKPGRRSLPRKKIEIASQLEAFRIKLMNN
jgi:hypothetical protein